ncbi:MAG: hypothetical protein ACR2HY_03955 [Acidimicrobiales bacterium]
MVLPNQPKLVILAVNIRCFSAQWDLNPDWQHHDVITAAHSFVASPSAGVPMTVVPRQSEVDRARYLATAVSCPGRPKASVADYVRHISTRPVSPEAALERSRAIFVFHYLSITASQSRRLRSFRALLMHLQQMGCKVFSYLTPVNCEAGYRLLGPEFRASVASTVATIRHTASSVPWSPNHFSLWDWTELLPARSFFHDLDPTEHLNQEGRARVAAEAVDRVVRLLVTESAG